MAKLESTNYPKKTKEILKELADFSFLDFE
jgi:hypothetical protein